MISKNVRGMINLAMLEWVVLVVILLAEEIHLVVATLILMVRRLISILVVGD